LTENQREVADEFVRQLRRCGAELTSPATLWRCRPIVATILSCSSWLRWVFPVRALLWRPCRLRVELRGLHAQVRTTAGAWRTRARPTRS